MGGFDEENKEGGYQESGDEREEDIKRSGSETSLYATDQEEEDDANIQLGPQYTLKEQLEKDKDDESLRRWKEQLLGSVDIDNVGETADPEVKIISLSILSPGRPDIVLPIPEDGKPKGLWFTLKEGSRYSLRFSFQVSNNIVVGFRYTNNVWKTGVKVDSAKEMLGTFSPQQEPYTFDTPEETTPSGYFARGQYSAKSKDKGLRELASKALSVLVKYDPEYSAHFILEKLIPCTLSSDLCMRHGATLATGKLVLALHRCSYALSTCSNCYLLF